MVCQNAETVLGWPIEAASLGWTLALAAACLALFTLGFLFGRSAARSASPSTRSPSSIGKWIERLRRSWRRRKAAATVAPRRDQARQRKKASAATVNLMEADALDIRDEGAAGRRPPHSDRAVFRHSRRGPRGQRLLRQRTRRRQAPK
ncbi:hypothetical protein AMJ85_06535 [candidate division BRC1 bacterium SM23_51]|nr:MAG: hypothetical protein AMJ85_06535 [candidate division BRC1 bacterium SM23_51]